MSDAASDLQAQQSSLYSRSWDEYEWNGERLYPVLLPLKEILRGSTARLHVPVRPTNVNVLGTPRCGTMWMVRVLHLLQSDARVGLAAFLFGKINPYFSRRYSVNHYHEGLIEDFTSKQKIVFIYRDIRDAIVSGYFYISNELHQGTMGCSTESFKALSKEEGLTKQIIMYMKYRMPVMNYWIGVTRDNVVTVRYENFLEDPEKWIKHVNGRCGISTDERVIRHAIEASSFEQMSGRQPGAEDRGSHQRKGISGDWRNHFTKRHMQIFREMGGEEFLVKLGYSV